MYLALCMLCVHVCTSVGIPIDMVGGTSMGSFVGALYCEHRDAEVVEEMSRKWARNMSTVWDKILDLTYPYAAMFTGVCVCCVCVCVCVCVMSASKELVMIDSLVSHLM